MKRDMDKKEFVKHLKLTGEVSTDQLVMFLLKYYLTDNVKDLLIGDFIDDLVFKYGCDDDGYIEGMTRSCLESIEKYIEKHKDTVQTWEEEYSK